MSNCYRLVLFSIVALSQLASAAAKSGRECSVVDAAFLTTSGFRVVVHDNTLDITHDDPHFFSDMQAAQASKKSGQPVCYFYKYSEDPSEPDTAWGFLASDAKPPETICGKVRAVETGMRNEFDRVIISIEKTSGGYVELRSTKDLRLEEQNLNLAKQALASDLNYCARVDNNQIIGSEIHK